MKAIVVLALAILAAILATGTAQAQQPRAQSINGAWLAPVAGNILCSDEHAHIGRGSVRAWDLCVPFGSAVYPISDGTVEYAGCSNAGGYGCWLYINHGNGFKAIYAHMDTGSITVRNGDRVSVNQIIGRVGWTGLTSFGPHVHLEIHHRAAPTGRVMIDDYFDRRLFEKCHLCNTPGKATVAAGTVSSRNEYRSSATLSQNAVVWLFGGLALLLLAYMAFSPKRALAQGLAHGLVVGLVVLLPLQVLQVPVNGRSTVTHAGGAKWDIVYGFMRRWEGARCVHDPVRTFKGVTQGTYNRYRMELGIGPGDVCTSLTEAQAKDIYYRYYFLASGADQLPTLIALHHFDFAVNAGTGAARKAYAQCGDDFGCYTRYRVSFYKSASLCHLYCAGWLNRVNDLQRYAKGIQ